MNQHDFKHLLGVRQEAFKNQKDFLTQKKYHAQLLKYDKHLQQKIGFIKKRHEKLIIKETEFKKLISAEPFLKDGRISKAFKKNNGNVIIFMFLSLTKNLSFHLKEVCDGEITHKGVVYFVDTNRLVRSGDHYIGHWLENKLEQQEFSFEDDSELSSSNFTKTMDQKLLGRIFGAIGKGHQTGLLDILLKPVNLIFLAVIILMILILTGQLDPSVLLKYVNPMSGT